MGTFRRLVFVVFSAGLGFIVGGCMGVGFARAKYRTDPMGWATFYPLPHHVPKNPGGLSFRFAMAHDVLHERYPRHGAAFHRERERIAREKLAKVGHNDRAAFPVIDDLATSLWGQRRRDEAITVMRDKIDRQRKASVEGRNLYTSYANLGTFLIQANRSAAMAGDAKAKEQFREGAELVQQAVKVNPEAHFGREQWQAAHGEFLLAAMDDPALLKKCDFLGNRLDLEVPLNRVLNDGNGHDGISANRYGRAYVGNFADAPMLVPTYSSPNVAVDDPARWAEFSEIRHWITKVGAEDGWAKLPVKSHREPVAFDEPALGVVGMWRQGDGADPHLALALGEIMLRVGQRYLAWSAFERAARLADGLSPDAAAQQFLRDHCHKRQQQIEHKLKAGEPYGSEKVSQAGIAQLRPQFESELAFGESYQRAYQEYEAAKIAAGANIGDDHFYDEFNASRPPIASATGQEELYATTDALESYRKRNVHSAYTAKLALSSGAVGAGVIAMVMALLLRRVPFRREL